MLMLESRRVFINLLLFFHRFIPVFHQKPNHLTTDPLENGEILFSSKLNVSTLRFSGNKIHCSPREQSLSVKYGIRVSVKVKPLQLSRASHCRVSDV